jgi:hypothetical protein
MIHAQGLMMTLDIIVFSLGVCYTELSKQLRGINVQPTSPHRPRFGLSLLFCTHRLSSASGLDLMAPGDSRPYMDPGRNGPLGLDCPTATLRLSFFLARRSRN